LSPNRFLSVLILLTCGLCGCSREKSHAPERLAVTPFENLSGSTEFDWLRRGLSAVVASDLTGLPKTYARAVDSVDGAYAMQATRALQGYFVQSGGRLEIHATVLDLASRKAVASFALEGAVPQGAISLADDVAKKLNPRARAFPTTNAGAFHAYGEALSAVDRTAALMALEAATKADPRFSSAYWERARLLAGGGDREGALRVIEEARREQPDSIASAKLDLLAATLKDDVAAREHALESLSRLTPADAAVFVELAQLELGQRKFSDAVRHYDAAAEVDPEDTGTWNDLGYAQAYAGNLDGARSALEQYRSLVSPENVNPLDSLGEVSFYLGDFGAAEKYFLDADRKNPGEFAGADLLKAAEARLMTGDLAGANSLFDKYVARAEGGQRGRMAFQKAQWEFLTGRRKAAMAGLERMLPTVEGDGRSLALSQLSVWKFQTGDQKAAEQFASLAGESAVSPAARNISAVCRAVLHPDVESGSRLADAYARIFAGKIPEAAPMLEMLYRGTNPHNDGEIRTLLAWAYVKMGRATDARALIGVYPLPMPAGEQVFASLVFPRYLFVRGAVLQQQGKRPEAKGAYELFLKYSGDAADIFGDETAARKNLSGL
jgi:tetratricopeptide (TPR) repeat protein